MGKNRMILFLAGGVFVVLLVVVIVLMKREKAYELVNSTEGLNTVLVSGNSSETTKRLYEYLNDVYGKKILAGQQASCDSDYMIERIVTETGKSPAVRGFDFMDYSPSRVEFGSNSSETQSAVEWWNSGGIVTFCWHWNAPMDLINEEPDKLWWSGFYTRATTFDLQKALADKNSVGYELLIRDIDAIAVQLKELQKNDVPVLWRPLHEASGGWFWWGAKGAEACKELWIIMFDRLNNYHQLDNLIWVWNGQNKNWYPGDEYVDIMGEDIYAKAGDYSSQKERFVYCFECSDENKMIALTENGVIPDPDSLVKDGVHWLWFCTWAGEFVVDEKGAYSEKYTDIDMLKKVYGHEYVITKDELPNLK